MSGLGSLIHLHGRRLRRLLTDERDTPLLAAGAHLQVYALGAWLRFLMPYLFVNAQEAAVLLPHLANLRYTTAATWTCRWGAAQARPRRRPTGAR